MLRINRHVHFRHLVAFIATILVIVSSLAIFSSSQAAGDESASQNANPAIPAPERRALPDLNSPDANSQLMAYYARDLYSSEHLGAASDASSMPFGSPEAMKTMLAGLQPSQSTGQSALIISAFVVAPPAVVPALLDALTDADPAVRRGAAEILGARRAPEAEDSLFFATYDTDAGVRAAAIKALGELGAIYVLPRLGWLTVTENDPDAQLAARLAEKQIYAHTASILGMAPGDLRAVAVAPANQRVYAAAKSDLYAPNGPDWGRVGPLPDTPTALTAAGSNGRILYLGTATSGVFRSSDGGLTWQAINAGLPAATQFAVTALTVSPADDRQVYIALADNSGAVPLTPYGLFVSPNAGESWAPLTQWKVDRITTRLVVDPNAPARLLGWTDSGVWTYPLAKPVGR